MKLFIFGRNFQEDVCRSRLNQDKAVFVNSEKKPRYLGYSNFPMFSHIQVRMYVAVFNVNEKTF